MTRVLICGDRDYKHDQKIFDYVQALNPLEDIIIHGNARGADFYASTAAKLFGFAIIGFPAQWNKYGKSAGPIRNQQMLDEGKPDLIVYFHDNIKKSKGTKDMVSRAEKAGLPVLANPTGEGEQHGKT